jgi:23S rRNA (adenine-N6)-dimethyltransferase
VSVRARRARLALSQNFLVSEAVAAQLVESAEIGPRDLVLDLGAGTGVLTAEIASRAGRVVAVELDPDLAGRLRHRFAASPSVDVLEADLRSVRMPATAFKVVSNPPFHLTSDLLHRLLDDPRVPLARAELVLSWGAAIGRASVYPSSVAALSWQPWFELVVTRRLPARLFAPAPASDAGVLSIRRRPRPLIALEARRAFVGLLRSAFRRGTPAAVLGRERWGRLAGRLGLTDSARASDLDVWQWVRVFEVLSVRPTLRRS